MEIAWQDCMVCGDTITNMVCYRCMEGHILEWLRKENSALRGSVKRVGEFFSAYTNTGALCILCGSGLNACGKCYSLAVHKALRKNRIVASEFLDFAASKGFMLYSKKRVLSLER